MSAIMKKGVRSRAGGSRSRRPGLIAALLVGAVMVPACSSLDEILEVDIPGAVQDSDLTDPRLAATLARSAQNDFECGFAEYVWWTGIWTSELQDLGGGRPDNLLQTRASSYNFYADPCGGTSPNYAPLQTGRGMGRLAYDIISQHEPSEVVGDVEQMMASSKLYEAYAVELLSETYCAVTLGSSSNGSEPYTPPDGGPLKTRGEGLRIAEELFGVAIDHASRVTNAAEGTRLKNAALVGRARARLQLGDDAGVLADAGQVPIGFVFNAVYDENPSRRRNNMYESINEGTSNSVGVKMRPLRFLGEVLDPRVPIVLSNRVSSQANNIPIWDQKKFLARGADMPIGTGREAKLMVAEVELGQTAVNIINELRTTPSPYVPAPAGGWPVLPVFASANAAEILAQVKEERMRETFLQGTGVGDLLRWGGPWPTGADERGRAYFEENTCMHVPEFEAVSNPNIVGIPPTTPTSL
jgi:hypothetical protein